MCQIQERIWECQGIIFDTVLYRVGSNNVIELI